MKTASELISFLVKDKHFSLCSVCELHKPCATTPRCSWEPAKRFVNFDDVKTAYLQGTSGDFLCFSRWIV